MFAVVARLKSKSVDFAVCSSRTFARNATIRRFNVTVLVATSVINAGVYTLSVVVDKKIKKRLTKGLQ
jgi:hypothetical protein